MFSLVLELAVEIEIGEQALQVVLAKCPVIGWWLLFQRLRERDTVAVAP
jgi:hypothetical protein